VNTREQDAQELAAVCQRVDDAAAAFMKCMEAALPKYVEWMEARKARDAVRAVYTAKYVNK